MTVSSSPNHGKQKSTVEQTSSLMVSGNTEQNMKNNSKPQTSIIVATVAICLAIVLISTLVWWYFYADRKDNTSPYPGIQVEQKITGIPSGLKIGIVVSYTEDSTQGAGWDSNGEGISIAKWRLAQGGVDVDTILVSDQGNETDAAVAITKLKDSGVSGVIALTKGTHTDSLAQAAKQADLPIIFPYQFANDDRVEGVWYGLPPLSAWQEQMNESISELACAPTIFVGADTKGLKVSSHISNSDPEEAIAQINQLVKNSERGCVVLDDNPENMLTFISLLQTHQLKVRVIVGDSGLNTLFTTGIVNNGLEEQSIYSLGPAAQSYSTLNTNIGYNEAKALMRQDSQLKSLREDTEFFNRANLADSSSYEAFIALVKAAKLANSTDSQQISKALHSLQIPAEQTINGVEYDYSKSLYQKLSLVQLIAVGEQQLWLPPVQQ